MEASIYAYNQEWSTDEQVAKDIQLIDSIAKKQAQIFSDECKLFPADIQIQSIYPLPDVSELEKKLLEQSEIFLSLQQKIDDLASKVLLLYLDSIFFAIHGVCKLSQSDLVPQFLLLRATVSS
ncbi:hypothetical protein ACFX2G_047855 [Malus domestica]